MWDQLVARQGEYRVLVCGDRNWSDEKVIFRVLDSLLDRCREDKVKLVIIEGEAEGADKLSRVWASSRKVSLEAFPAEWERYGKAAGPLRNRRMIEEGDPDEVVAFHDNIGESKGTRNMISQAERAGIRLFGEDGREHNRY